jgi:ubiquinone/menaquinone biosynthesis C-methylase UbiE
MKELSFEQIEQVGREWTDKFAAQCGWKNHVLKDPIDDLQLFFDRIPGIKMLDVGCGWGRYIFRFFDQGLVYQGIDHSVEMLRAARKDNPNATLHEGSFRALPFPSDHFDGLWSCCSLSAIPKAYLIKILQEHLRVLKPGGVMYIVMPAPPESQEMMYRDDDGNPEIYQAHYHLGEFQEYVNQSGFKILDADYRHEHGSFYVLCEKLL